MACKDDTFTLLVKKLKRKRFKMFRILFFTSFDYIKSFSKDVVHVVDVKVGHPIYRRIIAVAQG